MASLFFPWIPLTILCVLLDLTTAREPCSPCKCTATSADCSNRNLSKVPDIPPRGLTSLNLNHNNLITLAAGALKNFVSLEILDLSVNRLSKLHNKSFDGLSNLRELYLNDNQLKYLPEVFPREVFVPLSQLQRLWLHNNIGSQDHDVMTYPDEALSPLTSLVELRLDGLEIVELGQGFSRMRNLSSLSLSKGKCVTTNLTRSSFENVPGLQKLSVAHCALKHIDKEAFSPLTGLRELNLSNNKNLTLDRAGDALYGVQNSSLTTLDISMVEDTFAIGVVMRERYVRYLTNVPLKDLKISYNRVRLLEPGVPGLLPKTLEIFSLSGNDLTYGPYMSNLNKMTSVRVFNSSFQGISHTPPPSEGLLQGDKLPIFKVPPNATVVDISHSLYNFKIPRVVFTNNSLRDLFMSACSFIGWLGPMEGTEHLETLDLSHNYCYEVDSGFFQYMTSLKILDVSYNFLGFTLQPVAGRLFSAQKSLRILIMSYNKIRELPYNIFDGLDNIEELYLDNNELHVWNVSISHMKSLRLLDLGDNFLWQLTWSFQHQLDSLAPVGHASLELHLGYNTLRCTCYELAFWKWLQHNASAVEVRGVWNTSCQDATSRNKRFYDYDDIVSELDAVCANHAALFLGILVAALCVLAMVVAALGYRYRWKLRYLYYMARWKNQQEQRTAQDDFRYDAFISYADEDRSFVIKDMLKRLQEEAGLRLCIHHIHFRPGAPIAENILQAVRESRKTVVVLSPDFINSYWCDYEVQMAQMEEVYGRRSVLLVLLYRSVVRRRLSPTLLHVIRRDSYLEFPCDPACPSDLPDPQSLEVFWHNLKRAIKEDISP